MAKRAFTFRFDDELAARVDALRKDDETNTALYSRVLAAGVESIESQGAKADDDGEASEGDSGLIYALNRHIEQLTAELENKNSQLSAALAITAREQELRLLESRTEQPTDEGEPVEVDEGTSADEARDGARDETAQEVQSESRFTRWLKSLF